MDIVFWIEIIGTVAFALSGTLVAIRNAYDIFGIAVLACVTASGGGILRDMMLGNTPPVVLRTPVYLLVATGTALAAVLCIRLFRTNVLGNKTVERLFFLFDAVGLAMFTVSGVNIALSMGENAFVCIMLGLVTGVGGGVARDVLARSKPVIFRKHIYAVASLLGAVVYYYGRLAVQPGVAMLLSVGVCVALRLLSHRYNWNLPTAN